jgi:hypothetical protein
MGTYDIDTQIQIVGSFASLITGLPADPTIVTLYIMDPDGNEMTQTFPGNLTKTDIGSYSWAFNVTISGDWTYKWQGVGAVIVTSPDTKFTVRPSVFIPG